MRWKPGSASITASAAIIARFLHVTKAIWVARGPKSEALDDLAARDQSRAADSVNVGLVMLRPALEDG